MEGCPAIAALLLAGKVCPDLLEERSIVWREFAGVLIALRVSFAIAGEEEPTVLLEASAAASFETEFSLRAEAVVLYIDLL